MSPNQTLKGLGEPQPDPALKLSEPDVNRKAFADRLRQLKGDMSEKALGDLIGVSQTAINGYLNAVQDPKRTTLIQIAKHFSVSLDWLVMGEDKRLPQHQAMHMSFEPIEADTVMIPFYDVRASAGPGIIPVDERPVTEMPMPRNILRQLDISPQNAELLTVQGDSAEPTMSEGDIILIDRALRDLRDGCMYVIGLDDDVLVKRVERMMDGSVVLSSDNPRYRPQTVPAPEVERLRVVGRVRWALHQL